MIKINNLLDGKQNLNINKKNKSLYGEIFTPYSLIETIISLLPEYVFYDKNLRWLDPGAGTGYFSIFLYYKLNETLKEIIPNNKDRSNHIITNMLFMIEINELHCIELKHIFGENANILNANFLCNHDFIQKKFDIIVGNPPFNSKGIKKVPTNKKTKKTQDGSTIWGDFLKNSMSLLKSKGLLCFITPSIWMKPDKARLYHFINQYKIHKLHALTNTQSNKIFKGEAQTPCAFYLIEKIDSDNKLDIYDYDKKKYITYSLKPEIPIPVFGVEIINKFLLKFNNKNNKLKVFKSNLPSKDCILYDTQGKNNEFYKNIHTCTLNNLTPQLIIKYSSKPCVFYNRKKLVMAHGMYGFPYLDINGEYGISNRDKYVILRESTDELIKLAKFFSTKTALYLFESTRYRMKYLERYIFELIPDITCLDDFPDEINDDTIAEYFKLSQHDKDNIQNLNKNYQFFSFN
jgi:tRNA1(Val) A37 N6-methylase TrmN6|tara:strand:- start:1235 stop:2617 length:1383 start_codon:yes stop_codon:yes gene_type:complete